MWISSIEKCEIIYQSANLYGEEMLGIINKFLFLITVLYIKSIQKNNSKNQMNIVEYIVVAHSKGTELLLLIIIFITYSDNLDTTFSSFL